MMTDTPTPAALLDAQARAHGYRTLAERIVRSACCASQFDIDHAERLITTHFAARDAAAWRLVEAVRMALPLMVGESRSMQNDAHDREVWDNMRTLLRTAADALAALLPEQEEPR